MKDGFTHRLQAILDLFDAMPDDLEGVTISAEKKAEMLELVTEITYWTQKVKETLREHAAVPPDNQHLRRVK